MDVKTKKPEHKTVLFIKNVPPELKAHFHAYCAKRNKSMREVLLTCMRTLVVESERGERGGEAA